MKISATVNVPSIWLNGQQCVKGQIVEVTEKEFERNSQHLTTPKSTEKEGN